MTGWTPLGVKWLADGAPTGDAFAAWLSASVDTRPQGQDPQGLDACTGSAVGTVGTETPLLGAKEKEG